MRTEDERITNHEDGSPVNEPNETTPLTEPEYVAQRVYLFWNRTDKVIKHLHYLLLISVVSF
jgi:hypothetical protein